MFRLLVRIGLTAALYWLFAFVTNPVGPIGNLMILTGIACAWLAEFIALVWEGRP